MSENPGHSTSGATRSTASPIRWRPWVALALFAALSLTTVLRHEMWRDEIHSWQAVITADSPRELVENVRVEGHPMLWPAILYPVSGLTADPIAMQLVHWMIAVGVAALVLFCSPFPLSWRVLIVLGYFSSYEYCVVSRNYAVGALLLFAFCAVYPIRARRPLTAASLLFLLAQANVYALILSFALGVMWCVEDRWWNGAGAGPAGALRGAAAIWLTGMAVSVIQMLGALAIKQPIRAEKIIETGRTLEVLATPWRAMAPVPVPRFRFWNSNFLDPLTDGAMIQSILGLALIAVIASLVLRRRPVAVFYLTGTAGLIAFTFVYYVGHLRHHGHHLLLLLATLWLVSAASGERARGFRKWLVVAILVANASAGIYATARDWRDPFSAGRATADAIRAGGLVDLPMVGHREVQVATVAGYLDRPVYYPTLGREMRFIAWDSPGWRPTDDADVLRQAGGLARERDSDVLIIFSRGRRPRPDPFGPAVRIGDFSKSMVRTERFELYLLPADAAPAGSGP